MMYILQYLDDFRRTSKFYDKVHKDTIVNEVSE